MACPQLAIWAAAGGELLIGYQFTFDGQPIRHTEIPEIEICIDDDQIHTLKVIAIYPDYAGEPVINVGTLAELAAPPAPTATPTVTPTVTPTPTPTATPTPWPRPPDAVCADFNESGVVDIGDWGRMQQLFGTRNDGVQEIE